MLSTGKLGRFTGGLPAKTWCFGGSATGLGELAGRSPAPVRTVLEAPAQLRSLVGELASSSKQRSVTPAGFARAFADANP